MRTCAGHFIASISLALVGAVACTDRSDTSSNGGSGSDGTPSDGGTGGEDGGTGSGGGGTGSGGDDGGTSSGGDDGGTGTGATEPGSSGEPIPCGDGVPCDPTDYCDFVMNSCGTLEYDESECAPRPEGCDGQYLPACGCDGEVYSNACEAASAGVDIADAGGCDPPDGMFPCGHLFCELATQYCRHSVSDVLPYPDDFTCMPLPPDCGNAPSCDCLANEPCAEFDCSEVPGGGFVLTCPGG